MEKEKEEVKVGDSIAVIGYPEEKMEIAMRWRGKFLGSP